MIKDVFNGPFPILMVNDEYFLREQSVDDAATFFNYYKNPNVTQYILATDPKSVAEAREEIHYCRNIFYNKRGLYWALARRDNNEIIGSVGLYTNNFHHRAELCYDLSESYWRQGVMSAAIKTVIDFAFKKMDVHRLEAVTMKANIPSQKILQKMGFIYEGTMRNYRRYQNRPNNVEMFALTPDMLEDTSAVDAAIEKLISEAV